MWHCRSSWVLPGPAVVGGLSKTNADPVALSSPCLSLSSFFVVNIYVLGWMRSQDSRLGNSVDEILPHQGIHCLEACLWFTLNWHHDGYRDFTLKLDTEATVFSESALLLAGLLKDRCSISGRGKELSSTDFRPEFRLTQSPRDLVVGAFPPKVNQPGCGPTIHLVGMSGTTPPVPYTASFMVLNWTQGKILQQILSSFWG
jgi:hypothetical protein